MLSLKCYGDKFDHYIDWQGRLKPGRMLLVDTKKKMFMKDEEVKLQLANLRPTGTWLQEVTTLFMLNLVNPFPQTAF